MIRKLAMLVAAATVLYVATPADPAAAQGISVQLGGGGYGGRDHGYRDRGYRGRDFRRGPPRHWDRGYHRGGPRGRTIIVR